MVNMRELIKSELNKGITQRELAGKIGFSHSTIQKILFTETKHTYEIRKKVADYFGVPVSDFYSSTPVKGEMKSTPSPDAEYWKDKFISCMMELNEARKKIERLTAPPGGAENDAG